MPPHLEWLEPRLLMSASIVADMFTDLFAHQPDDFCRACTPIEDFLQHHTAHEVDTQLAVDYECLRQHSKHAHDDLLWNRGGEYAFVDGTDQILNILPIAQPALEPSLAVGATVDIPVGPMIDMEVGNDVPLFHSNVGAAATVYLDFDGHFERSWGAYDNLSTPAYDIDSNTDAFTGTELARIEEIWQRVSEDFVPFDIDVTTENPSRFTNRKALRIAIGGSSYDWLGLPAGGVAYIDAFTNTIVNTVYVFPDQLANGMAKYVAEATTHEAGHALGLRHQSEWADENRIVEYHMGSDGWAPLMGAGYYEPMTTWHNGQNPLGSYQDDLSILSSRHNGFGYRSDDHGDSLETATLLDVFGESIDQSGILEQNHDVDVFVFDTAGGLIDLDVNVADIGANLDVMLELYDSKDNLAASSNPDVTYGTSITTTVSRGTYTLHVKNTGDYGRLGQYRISGTTASGDPSDGSNDGDDDNDIFFGANLIATYIDDDGDLVKIKLKGPGNGQLILADGDSGDALEIILANTTDKSILTILTRGKGSSTSVGNMLVEGSLKRLRARTTDLNGDLTIGGGIKTIHLGNVNNVEQQSISIGLADNAKWKTSIKIGQVSELSIESKMGLRMIKINEWFDRFDEVDDIIAPSLGKLMAKGDFGADLRLTNASVKRTLGRVKIGGWLDNADIESAGNIGSILVGGMRNSSLMAGVHTDAGALPDDSGNFDEGTIIKSLRIKGIKNGNEPAFSNSYVAAWSITKAIIKSVQEDNDGQTFGLAMNSFGKIKYSDSAGPHKLKNGGVQPMESPKDFIIQLI